ncbi:MAG: hypothetical protein RMI56_05065 [Sulfolobales archaeon]|nr:hypothetical protein [Sulfolobales archaeon]MDW8083151.1 hypothetical protein [Sulfolobales archaeon]
MSSESRFLNRVEKVVRDVESLLMELEALRDDLKHVVAEVRVSRDRERMKTLESLSADLEKAYETLKSLYRQLTLVRLKYS